MELHRAIQELRTYRDQLAAVIAELETLNSSGTDRKAPGIRSRRGRKSMGAAERREVSKRMKEYWARRRRTGARRD